MKISLFAAFGLAASLTGSVAQTSNSLSPQARGTQSCRAVSANTCALAHALGRGINMGDMLEAPREGDWGVRLDPAYIDKVAGLFNTVRVPVRWSNHAAQTSDATLEDFFAARVDTVVDKLLAKGLYVILDMHHYSQIFGDSLHPNEVGVDPAVLEVRFINMWRQISLRYKDRSPKLVFELLNEPHGLLDGASWNVLLAKALATVRVENPTRTILIGPGSWNSVLDLPKVRFPADRNLVVAIHNYDPFEFTHQGVTYRPNPFPVGTTCCNTKQRKSITDALDAAGRWSQEKGYPLHLGEFGAYEAADMDSREVYTRFVRDEAERRGIGWAYWEFASAFGVYSPKAGEWVEPLRRALLD